MLEEPPLTGQDRRGLFSRQHDFCVFLFLLLLLLLILTNGLIRLVPKSRAQQNSSSIVSRTDLTCMLRRRLRATWTSGTLLVSVSASYWESPQNQDPGLKNPYSIQSCLLNIYSVKRGTVLAPPFQLIQHDLRNSGSNSVQQD